MNHPAGLDLASLQQGFLDEAAEHADRLEQLLLGAADGGDDETLHALFRSAHSIKGGAAAFGFDELTELTHRMETLLDRLRRHELAPSAARIDALLAATDALRAQLAQREGRAAPAVDTAALCRRLAALAEAEGGGADAPRRLELTLGPLDDEPAVRGLLELFDEIVDLGRIAPLPADGTAAGLRRFEIETHSSDAELLDLFSLHVDADKVRLQPLPPQPAASSAAPAPAAPPPAPAPAAEPAREAATLRVAAAKVDELLDRVGELVVAQSALTQAIDALDAVAQRRLAAAAAELQRHARALHEQVLAVRMVPVATLFARLPRLVRDLAAGLGKPIDLRLSGESTELDRGMAEALADPLTHLVRNACDHGIEPPAERRARGKPERGTLVLAAETQGDAVLIELRDDGAGLSRTRLLARARALGLAAPDSLPDAQVWALAFAPGLSTAERVSEVSGRGVGMDVVQRNIAALGGSVELDSREGQGLTVRVRVPLTLAIVDALAVRVGDETYLLPGSGVVETCLPGQASVQPLAGVPLLRWRDELLPVIDLARAFELPRAAPAAQPLQVVVEAAGRRGALQVDEVLGLRAVVVKSLEPNFRRVDFVSAATILGDGRVALIVDLAALLRTAPA